MIRGSRCADRCYPFPIRRLRRFARTISGTVLAALVLSGILLAQDETPRPAAVVTFTLDFPASNPSHYSITVDADGHATYECSVKVEDTPDPQTYNAEFRVTPGSRGRIFEWAKQAKYFSGNVDSGKDKIAFTGDKTLSFQEGQRSFSTRYNFSTLEPVRQLTALFQNMQSTLDYGRRLEYFHRYQKLALDEELKRMEGQARNNELSEIQAIAPALLEIIDDTSVINVVRARAKEIVQMGNRPAAGR